MTENRIDHLITYFNGSVKMLKELTEKNPDLDNANSKIASSIFTDTLNILNHIKNMPEELEKINQSIENFDTIFDEISSFVGKKPETADITNITTSV